MQMRRRSLRNVIKQPVTGGSITVFLSFLLIFMVSFIFTTLEGARITASRAQLSMLAELASKSLAAEYYYPLFEEYGMLAVDGGFGKTEFEREKLGKELFGYFSYAYTNGSSGILGGKDPKLILEDCGTMLDGEKSDIRQQIKDEALYEGAEFFLESVTGNEMFASAGVLGKVYEKQAAAMQSTAAVTEELLKLMALIDGVQTTENGLYTDENGNLQPASSFLKMLGVKDEKYMKSTYGSVVIYDLVKSRIVYCAKGLNNIVSLADREEVLERRISAQSALIRSITSDMNRVREEIAELNERKKGIDPKDEGYEESVRNTEQRIAELETLYDETCLSLNSASIILDDLRSDLANTIFAREGAYDLMRKVIDSAYTNAVSAFESGLKLRIKQKAVMAVMDEYTDFIKETEGIPGQLLDSLLNDAVHLKDYVSLEKSGYDTEAMLNRIGQVTMTLGMARLPGAYINRTTMRDSVRNTADLLNEMNYDGLRFNYSGLRPGRATGKDVKKTLSEAMAGGLLDYLGVEDVSEKKLNGLDLPSKGEYERSSDDIFTAFSKMSDYFKDTDPAKLLLDAGEELTSDFLTEVWLKNHFSDRSSVRGDTRLDYERKYVLSGKMSDAENLASVALKLAVLRAVFTFTSLLADAERSGEATALAASISGFTGIPALLYVVKYAILTVWAIEEAMVEVSALFMGKQVPIYSPKGRIGISEILVMTGERVKAKAKNIGDDPYGADYMLYLTVLSFFEGLNKKELRIADIIQENIRLKYRDTFRMENAVTEWKFTAEADALGLFDTGVFTDKAYKMCVQTGGSY